MWEESFLWCRAGCVQVQVQDSKVVKIPIEELPCQHHEADTQIILHARFVAEKNKGSVIAVRSSDTDVFVFLLHFAYQLNVHLLMDIGSSSKNTRNAIDITNLAQNLASDVCAASPGLHTFIGCDFTAEYAER